MIDILDALTTKPMTLSQLCALDRDDVDDVLYHLRGLARLGAIEPARHADRLYWRLPGQPLPGPRAPPQPIAQLHRAPHDRRHRHVSRDERPSPMEILSRMVVRSSFRTPKGAGSSMSVPVTPIDIAHAVGASAYKLGAAMAMAIACQRPQEWLNVLRLGRTPLLHHLRNQRAHIGIVDAPYTYRARVVLHDAFHDLVQPTRRRCLTTAAADVRMRRDRYVWMIRETTAFLEAEANSAAADAVAFLFATYRRAATEQGLQLAVAISVDDEVQLEMQSPVDVDELCRDVLARPPRNGVLHLAPIRAAS